MKSITFSTPERACARVSYSSVKIARNIIGRVQVIKMWSEDGAKRSRKDYFLAVKKLTIPVGFDKKCSGKCGAFCL